MLPKFNLKKNTSKENNQDKKKISSSAYPETRKGERPQVFIL